MFRKVNNFEFFLIDRYILGTFLKNLVFSLSFFLAIYFFSTMLTELPDLLKKAAYNPAVNFKNIMLNYSYKIPGFFFTIFPFAYLFSTSFILGSFFKNNEIISIVSAGMSIRRITFPIVLTGLACSIVLMFSNFFLVPDFNYKSAGIEEKLYQEAKVKDVDNVQNYGENGLLYFARYYNAKSKIFISFMLLKTKEGIKLSFKDFKKIDFQKISTLNTKGQIDEIAKNDFSLDVTFPYEWLIQGDELIWNEGQQAWIVKEGYQWKFDSNGKILSVDALRNTKLSIAERPEFFSKETRDIKEMSVTEGRIYIDKLKKSRQSYEKELVEFYSEKYAKPFSVFILALLSSAMGKFFSRKHLLVSTLLASFVIGTAYYVLINIGISLGKEKILTPFLAAFLGNFLSIGLYFWIKKHQMT